MKKILAIVLISVLAITACTSDEKDTVIPTDPIRTPIEDLKLPSLAEGKAFKAGEELTIEGKGFTEKSEIWFKSTTKIVSDNKGLKAEIKRVSNTGITIMSPIVYGEQELFLGQGTENLYSLGKLTFREKSSNIGSVEQFQGTFFGNSDIYTFNFAYTQDNKLSDLAVSYPFSGKIRILDFKIYYNEDNSIKRITSQVKGQSQFMGDGVVTYPSKTTVAVDKIDVKKYNYTLNAEQQLVMVADSRNDKVDKFAYDANGNMTKYTEIDYGHAPVVVMLTYDSRESILSSIKLPSWAWHFILTDIASGNAYMYSFFSKSNAITIGEQVYDYKYNEYNQPLSIVLNGEQKGSVTYTN